MPSPKIPTGRAPSGASWKKGQSGNPNGRPKGRVETIPRGYVRALVIETIEQQRPGVVKALERAATSPRTVVSVLDHAAKLNKEIGRGADGAGGATFITFNTNVNFTTTRA